MMAHHFITVLLVLCSRSVNYFGIGSAIMFIHMVTDVPTMAFKAYYDYVGKLMKVILYTLFIIGWYSRLIFLYILI